MSSGIKVAFGGGGLGSRPPFNTDEAVAELLDVLEAGGVEIVDTAQLYGQGNSEAVLGRTGAPTRFTIDTKAKAGFEPGSSTEEGVVAGLEQSLKRLQTDKVDVFYLHAPDASVPLASTLAGVNALHARGLFARFGLSNYTAAGVAAVHAHCAARAYVLPTVYQGNYSAVARRPDAELLPTLRRLGIAFYAYSPLAGGFLTKTAAQVLAGAGRFSDATPVGRIYRGLYGRPAYLDALEEWEGVAREEGVGRAELAYRWVVWHSPLRGESGDAVIVGASSIAQLKETLEGVARGPLSARAVEGVERVWESVKHEAPLDNYNG